MKQHRHSVPAILISHPEWHARAWLGVLCVVGSALSQAAPLAITGVGSYSQDFDTLPSSTSPWVDDSTIPGWYAAHTGLANIVASAGSSTSGALYSFGNASATERALGSLASGGAPMISYGTLFQNTTDGPVTINSISYTGEQWRNGGDAGTHKLAVSFQKSNSPIITPGSTSGWTAVIAADFMGPISGSPASALDGNQSANQASMSTNPNIVVAAGEYVMIRWQDPDDSGGDHGLAIDNLAISWIASPSISLSPGAIAFVGFNADGNDDLAFVALAPIAENAVIRFTDNEWNGFPVGAGGAFIDSNEGVITWTAPAGGVVAGTVVKLGSLATPAPVASVGTLTRSGDFDLGSENETVYAYQETTPSGFLALIATHAADSTTGTGLGPAHIIHLPNDRDVAAYTGSRSGQTSFASYLALLGDTGNWMTEDGIGNQSANGTAPDVPFASTAFTVTGGNTFASWLTTHAPDQSASQDHDGDGVANSVEYFFGATGSGFTPNPQADAAGVISYPHPSATPGVTYKVWTSLDLSGWTDVTASVDLTTPGFVKYALPAGAGKNFVRLEVFVAQ